MDKTAFWGCQPIEINAAGQIRGVHRYRVIARRLKPFVQDGHSLSVKGKDLQPNIRGGWQRIGKDRLAVKGVGIARVERRRGGCAGGCFDVDLILLQDRICIVVDEQDLCSPCLARFYMQAPYPSRRPLVGLSLPSAGQ